MIAQNLLIPLALCRWKMAENKLVKIHNNALQKVGNAIAITNKLLTLEIKTELEIHSARTRFLVEAVSKQKANDWNGALDAWTKRLELKINNDGSDYGIYFSCGMCRYKLLDYQKAIIDFSKAIELKNDYTYAYSHRAMCKSKIGDPIGAIKDYDKYLELKTNDALIYNLRGREKEKVGNLTGALKDYDKALELKKISKEQ